MITCLTNRIGDRAILISIGWLLAWGSLDYIYYLTFSRKEVLMSVIFVVLAAITKSAQIPFSS